MVTCRVSVSSHEADVASLPDTGLTAFGSAQRIAEVQEKIHAGQVITPLPATAGVAPDPTKVRQAIRALLRD